MEMWETTGRDAIDEYTADGRVVNVGTTGWMQLRNGGTFLYERKMSRTT